jgi:cholesterol oxidase
MSAEHFDVVVVGSGFGGSVMAYEVAAAGKRVCLLERGKAWAPGTFPRSPHRMKENFWDPSEGQHGLFNVWSFRHLDALVSSGLGGGSLIYANVLVRKDERWFVDDLDRGGYESWPVTRADLDPHYDAVEKAIGVATYPPHLQAGSARPREFAAAARRLGLDHRYLPLAVSFAPAGQPNGEPVVGAAPNRFGQTRSTCRLCGECDIGCNYGSKNTLDLTYVSAAEAAGAEVRTRWELRTIEPIAGGYRVGCVVHEPDREGVRTDTAGLSLRTLTCRALVLSAGTLGSTFLLLRNRANLPGLSAQLGTRFCGNGDFLGLAARARAEDGRPRLLDPGRGPVITGGVRIPDEADGGTGRGLYVEDAGYPELFNWMAELALAASPGQWHRFARYAWGAVRRRLGLEKDTDLGAELARLFGECSLTKSSMPMLGMGRDVPDGTMRLAGERHLEVDWKIDRSRTFFDRMEQTMQALARELGATYQRSPLFALRRLITVHPLGGCPMGRHPGQGVVDDRGEVFGHRGLFVADGAVMPGPVGPNPSLTIAAIARRSAERVIARVGAA